jgi:hypothetical protein
VTLAAGGRGSATKATAARDLRPAAVIVLPDPCACAPAMLAILTVVHSHGLRAAVVAPPGDTQLASLAEPDPRGIPGQALLDSGGRLAAAYGTQSGLPTVVVVDARGVVTAVLRGVADDLRVRAALDAVTTAG